MPDSAGPRREGFTLIEVMAAVAIAGLVIAAGFKLVTVSLRALIDVQTEREMVNEAQKIYLDYMTKEDMPDRGDRDSVKWETEEGSVPAFGGMELKFRRLTIDYKDKQMVLFLPASE